MLGGARTARGGPHARGRPAARRPGTHQVAPPARYRRKDAPQVGRFTLPRDLPVRAARPQGEPQRAQVQQWKMLTATLLPPAFPRGDGKGRLGTTPGGMVNAPCVWVPRRVRGAGRRSGTATQRPQAFRQRPDLSPMLKTRSNHFCAFAGWIILLNCALKNG